MKLSAQVWMRKILRMALTLAAGRRRISWSMRCSALPLDY